VSALAALNAPLVFAASALVLVMACSSESTGGTATDAGSSSGASGNDGGSSGSGGASGNDGGASSGDASVKADGSSDPACAAEGLPTAPASCTVAGTYVVSGEIACPSPSPSCTSARGFGPETWTVTVEGDQVKFRATDVGLHCTLSGCTCTSAGGSPYIFTATGFVTFANNSDGTCSWKTLEKGVRQ
jgi:hypothetical protein